MFPRQLRGAAGLYPGLCGDNDDDELPMELIPLPTATTVKHSYFISVSMLLLNFSQYRDPLHILSEYIAKVGGEDWACVLIVCVSDQILTWAAQQAPDCDMVLIHDDDLAQIDGICEPEGIVSQLPYLSCVFLPHLWLQRTLRPDTMMDFLHRSKPEILQHVARGECLSLSLPQPGCSPKKKGRLPLQTVLKQRSKQRQ
jgi:hypothetical protein